MRRAVLSAIKEYAMLKPGMGVVVGLSGGADSVALAHFLCNLPFYDLRIVCVHINHGLRGREAEEDAAFCEAFCAELGVDFISFRVDVAAAAKKSGTGLEEAGRKLRYDHFYKVLYQLNYDKIAVAHNKNDVAETAIMQVFRGAGGIKGIRPAKDRVIRPLIDVSRAEIVAYCAEHKLAYREDSTNRQSNYTRNWIRNFLLPNIERRLNPSAINALARLTKIADDERDFLDKIAKGAYEKCVHGNEIRVLALNHHHTAVQRRVMRLVLRQVFGNVNDIAYSHTEALLALAHNQSGKTVSLPQGFVAEKSYDTICITKPSNFEGLSVTLTKNARIYVSQVDRWVSLGSPPLKENVFTKPLDCDKIANVQIRSRQPGDRIFFKNVGTKKVKDFFSDKKIPRARREEAVFIASGRDIILIIDKNGLIESDKFAPAQEDKTIFLQIWRPVNE